MREKSRIHKQLSGSEKKQEARIGNQSGLACGHEEFRNMHFVNSIQLNVAIALSALAFLGTNVEARDETGPKSPTLRFQMVKPWLRYPMRLEVGEIYSGKRYPKDVALSVAGVMVVVPPDHVVVLEGAGEQPISVAEIEQRERERKGALRDLQVRNPDFHAYSTGKMSEADRGKLEAEASEAMMSVEEYTALSGLERSKAKAAGRAKMKSKAATNPE